MKLLFINSAYPKEIESYLRVHSKTGWQSAANVFQWAVIEGLEKSGVDYSLVCLPALPAWPRYDKFFTPKGEMKVDNNNRGCYLSYCTAPAINQLYRKKILKEYLRNWCEQNKTEEKIYVVCYTQQADYLGAVIDVKKVFPNVIVAPIITDLIDNALDFADNRSFFKRIQVKLEEKVERMLFPKVDKFILLSKYMIECIPEAEDRNMVMEGLSPIVDEDSHLPIIKDNEVRTLLYTGTFQEFGGLKMLVDAFLNTKDPRFRLVLCGNGALRQYVESASLNDNRIVYKGMVSHDEVVVMQRESTLLINPRRPNGGITKYSFPSKTMEYMSSMTPMIGYHLEGIPEEYYKYMFTPKDLSQEALTVCINHTLALPIDYLQNKAKEAFDYVAVNKNCVAQVRRLIDFLMS